MIKKQIRKALEQTLEEMDKIDPIKGIAYKCINITDYHSCSFNEFRAKVKAIAEEFNNTMDEISIHVNEAADVWDCLQVEVLLKGRKTEDEMKFEFKDNFNTRALQHIRNLLIENGYKVSKSDVSDYYEHPTVYDLFMNNDYDLLIYKINKWFNVSI